METESTESEKMLLKINLHILSGIAHLMSSIPPSPASPSLAAWTNDAIQLAKEVEDRSTVAIDTEAVCS